MTIDFFNWFQLAVLAFLACIGVSRALILQNQKVRVLVKDSQMSKIQLINGLFFVSCFVAWIFESVVYALSLPYHIPSAILHTLLIQHIGISILAAFVLIVGLLIYGLALLSFGNSWRIGIDRETPGKLVTNGIFGIFT